MYPTGQSPQMLDQQSIVITVPQNFPKVVAYQSRQSIANGILQIIVGAFCIILNSVTIGLDWGFFGHGFLGGAFYITTGSIGIVAGKKVTKCLMIAHMILCITASSFFAPGHLSASLFVLVCVGGQPELYDTEPALQQTFTVEIIQAVLVAIEFAFAVWGSTIWCKFVGCCRDPQAMAAVQSVHMIDGQPIILAQSPGGQLEPFVTQQPQYRNYPMPSPPSYDEQEQKYYHDNNAFVHQSGTCLRD